MSILWKNIILLVLVNITLTKSYRILAIFPINSKSHDSMFNALMKGLAKRNHQVDVVTHFPPENPPPNYNVVVDLNGTLENLVDNMSIENATHLSLDATYNVAEEFGNRLCRFLELEKMQKLIKNLKTGPSYDLVITEALGTQCYFGFGYLLKVPVIGITSLEETPWLNEMMGNPGNTAFVPHVFYGSFDKFNFWDRLQNTISYYWQVYRFNQMTGKTQTDLIRKYLSPDMPDVRELEKNVVLTFINRHPVINSPKPLTSAMIEISGLHINKESKLSTDLQKWLDESVDGVVYFTFGSMVLFETLPVETINAFYKSFSKLKPIRVLMKVVDEKKLPPGLPDNVKTLPWIAQQAVLAHKNVRTFITHGGLMGTQEALYFAVPMIGIPLFGDQASNIAKYQMMKMAVKIDFNNITTTSLDEALNLVLNDPKYRKNAQIHSKLFKDRPTEALDTAIFWVEYIIRNGGEILKSPAMELSTWQLLLLDVYGFILFCLILIFSFLNYFIKLIVRTCFVRSLKKLKTS